MDKSKIIFDTVKTITGLNNRYQVNYIKHITYEVTNLCNSKCNMCNIWANVENPGEMTPNDIDRAFSDPIFSKLESIILTGGEVFYRDDVNEIIRAINKNCPDAVINLSTNGLIVDKVIDSLKYCIDNKISCTLGISLDGVGIDHDKRRRMPGNYEKVIEIIQKTKDLQNTPNGKFIKSIGIGHCLDEDGLKTLSDVKKKADELEVGFLTQVVEDFDHYLPQKKRSASANDLESAMKKKKFGISGVNRITKKEFQKSKDSSKEDLRSRYIRALSSLPKSVHLEKVISVMKGGDASYDCAALWKFVFIKYNGDVTPCLRFADIPFGNLKVDQMSKIVNTSDYKKGIVSVRSCDGCLNTWCTSWSAEVNALPFAKQIIKRYAASMLPQEKIDKANTEVAI
jgi:hypothetical protein